MPCTHTQTSKHPDKKTRMHKHSCRQPTLFTTDQFTKDQFCNFDDSSLDLLDKSNDNSKSQREFWYHLSQESFHHLTSCDVWFDHGFTLLKLGNCQDFWCWFSFHSAVKLSLPKKWKQPQLNVFLSGLQ